METKMKTYEEWCKGRDFSKKAEVDGPDIDEITVKEAIKQLQELQSKFTDEDIYISIEPDSLWGDWVVFYVEDEEPDCVKEEKYNNYVESYKAFMREEVKAKKRKELEAEIEKLQKDLGKLR